MSAAQPTSPDVDAIASRYEELRDHAMAGTAGPLRGLVLLVREGGVVAWMRARDQCVRPLPAPSPAGRPAGDHTELVRLLADAALCQLGMATR
jgi:hypothetical protein